jgi:DNA-directed RNA polymerase subunit RPC12/RpoP
MNPCYLDQSASLGYPSYTVLMDAPPSSGNGMKLPARCPHCDSELIDRMARYGLGDYIRFLFGRYPFRCRRCGHEFYLPQRTTNDESS